MGGSSPAGKFWETKEKSGHTAMTCVLIASDIRLYREGLVEALGSTDGIEVVGAVIDGRETLRELSRPETEVVLIHMAIPDSLATVRAIAQTHPQVNVVALGVPEIEREVIACAEAGISGYVPRDGSVAQLIAAVKNAVQGELTCSPRIARDLLRHVALLAAERLDRDQGPWRLTPREMEIAKLVERGLSNKEIARELCIEISTVKNHVHSILERLNVQRRGEAAARLRTVLPQRSLLRQDLAQRT